LAALLFGQIVMLSLIFPPSQQGSAGKILHIIDRAQSIAVLAGAVISSAAGYSRAAVLAL
jgi:hypothetical protein